jgi:hypothetical protein
VQNVKSQNQYAYWKVLTPECLESEAAVLAEVSGFLKYELHIKGTVLYFWSSLRCIKIWIEIYCRGLKFPHRAVVLLVLESDGACISLNCHCARETEVLFLVWCYKARGDRKQDLWRYRLSEGCIKQRCDKHSGYGCLSKKCELWVQWSSELAVSCTLAKLSNIQSDNTGFETNWLSPLTRIHIDVADSSVLPLLFLKSLCILLGCPIINICSCYQYGKLSWVGPMEYHPHTGFHYSELLTYLCYDYSSFSNISGMDLGGSGVGS